MNAMQRACGVHMLVVDYTEHALGHGSDASAVAYVQVQNKMGSTLFGVGMHPNIVSATLHACVSAVNRHLKGSD